MHEKITDKRKDILEAALRLFAKDGFHGAPTSKIAKEAGVGTGALFHYFQTKEELINKLYLEIKKDLHSEMSAGLEPGRPSTKVEKALVQHPSMGP